MRIKIFIGILLLSGLIYYLFNRQVPHVNVEKPTTNALVRFVQTKRQDLLLPDLKITEPRGLYIERSGEMSKIRFETISFNVGEGPLELLGEIDKEREKTVATQVVKTKDGGEEKFRVGEFIFHPDHDHWHIENYTQFQLWRYGEDGNRIQLLATSNKLSFCIWDENILDSNVENVPTSRIYGLCSKRIDGTEIQGHSVGWGDRYGPEFEGQELDITNIPDGTYLVVSSINMDRKILERDYDNNEATIYVEIKEGSIRILDQ